MPLIGPLEPMDKAREREPGHTHLSLSHSPGGPGHRQQDCTEGQERPEPWTQGGRVLRARALTRADLTRLKVSLEHTPSPGSKLFLNFPLRVNKNVHAFASVVGHLAICIQENPLIIQCRSQCTQPRPGPQWSHASPRSREQGPGSKGRRQKAHL